MAMIASMIGSTKATKVDKSTFTSSSKNSARFSSMLGRAPVLSPTSIISSAIAGKNPLRRKPELSVCPAVTSFCASRIDWESNGLVTESLVVSSAGMIGRPPCTSVESVRANSATENFISNLPATGERNFRRSHHRRVAGDRNAERTPNTTSPVPTKMGARDRKRSEEHTSELQPPCNLVCRLLLEKKKKKENKRIKQPTDNDNH